ncbi:MAG: M24 family metallopeptidase [Treponema sp.]|jgi:Xaa-Pro aminopeptidase|nr:M24 family metallopeptidase [Treponema sp.]
MFNLEELQEAIRAEGLGGWLFSNFHHRDRLSDAILGIEPQTRNTRPWFYGVPRRGPPLRIVHGVEADALEGFPGGLISYISREDLIPALRPLRKGRWGVHSSERIPGISYLDAGTAALLKRAGLKLVSAEGLVQRFRGLLTQQDMAGHERAAAGLYEIVESAWSLVKAGYRRMKETGVSDLREGDIRDFMLTEMRRRSLTAGEAPIVAFGANGGNPHYDFAPGEGAYGGKGAKAREGDVVQFDLWAREEGPGSVFADISWVGVFAERPPPETEKCFGDLIEVREGTYAYIEEEMGGRRRLTGAMVDRKARKLLFARGYRENIRHRTGHGIDRELHGSGVNMDSVEFPDFREILSGSCFSLEPGIYFPGFGMRTEINVYIREGVPVISGAPHKRQFFLLTCG